MQGRAIRRLVVAFLIVSGGGAAFLVFRIQQAHESLVATQLAVATSLDQLAASVAEIGAAQQAYVIPGQPLRGSIQRVETLTRQVSDTATAIRPRLRSTDAASHLQALANTLDNLQQVDGRIRENLLSDDASAADVIFGDAREALSTMTGTIRALQAEEARNGATERAALTQQAGAIAGGVAVMWALGLILLARVPRRAPVTIPEPQAVEPLGDSDPSDLMLNGVGAAADQSSGEPPVDLAAAADICTEISRVVSSDALPDLLARAGVVLDASGIIVWLGAGEELFAITGYGYDAKLLARLGPIGRHANNATAAAWRTGQLGTVAGDMMSNGAIVAPMFGPDACIGVFAAEIRHGREADAATRAVTSMLAAQFATVVSAWPAPSSLSSSDDVGDTPADPLSASL
jgi:hypothetical protein